MPDNPQAFPAQDSAGFFALPDHAVLALTGRDAVAFAHAQFMSDVAALPAGQWQWSGWLTPKGRVIALFALARIDAETLWLVLQDVAADEFSAKLQRYVFRSKVALTTRADLQVAGAFAAPSRARSAALAGDGETEFDFGGEGGPRTLRISATRVADDAEAVARWAAFDLRHGLPRLPGSQAEQWTPQMLSLDRLRAFSVKKGCYPGQEIVARTHFLGQAKRGLALFEADAPVAAGSEVVDGEHALGTVVSTADAGNASIALAVLPLEREAGELSATSTRLRERPLLGGLGR